MIKLSRRELLKAGLSVAAVSATGCAARAFNVKEPPRISAPEPIISGPEGYDVDFDRYGLDEGRLKELSGQFSRISERIRIKLGYGVDYVYLPDDDMLRAIGQSKKAEALMIERYGRSWKDGNDDQWQIATIEHDVASLRGQLQMIEARLQTGSAKVLMGGFPSRLPAPAFSPKDACALLDADFPDLHARNAGLLLSMGMHASTLTIMNQEGLLRDTRPIALRALVMASEKGADIALLGQLMGFDTSKWDLALRLLRSDDRIMDAVKALDPGFVMENIGGSALGTEDHTKRQAREAIADFWLARIPPARQDDVTILYPGAGRDLLALNVIRCISEKRDISKARIIMTELSGAHIRIIREQLAIMRRDGSITGVSEQTVPDPGYGWEKRFDALLRGKNRDVPVSILFALRRSGDNLYRQSYFDKSDIVICHDSAGPFRNMVEFLLAQKRSSSPMKDRIFVSEDIARYGFSIPGASERFDGYSSCMCEDLGSVGAQLPTNLGMAIAPDIGFVNHTSERCLVETVHEGVRMRKRQMNEKRNSVPKILLDSGEHR